MVTVSLWPILRFFSLKTYLLKMQHNYIAGPKHNAGAYYHYEEGQCYWYWLGVWHAYLL